MTERPKGRRGRGVDEVDAPEEGIDGRAGRGRPQRTGEGARAEGARAGQLETGHAADPPYLWAGAATVFVGLLYAVTLAPSTAFWDASEYIATAHILGIPHPPGNPLFVILARSWELLLAPFGLSTPVRINLFSAAMGALAHGLWFLVAHRILSTFSSERRFALIGACAATLVSATAFTVWNHSNVNEKVYTVTLLTIALLTWLAFRWRDNVGVGKDDNILVLMVFILALSVGNHLMAFLAAPALLVFIFLVKREAFFDYRIYVAAAAVTLLGLSVNLFLPVRAALDPVINEADPTCESIGRALTSIVTWGQAGCTELSAVLSRQQYDKPPIIPRLAPLHLQYANYLQYFDWQWGRAIAGTNTVFPPARMLFTLLFGLLGIYGAVRHYRKDRISWWFMAVLFGTLSVALVFYLNFRYGYSLTAPVQDRDLHEVRERDYFFIVSFSLWGLWAGIGIAALWNRLARELGGRLGRAAPVLGLAVLPLFLNWGWASRTDDYAARDWGYNLLMSVEPYGILITNGDNDTFPLWYLQEVEGHRQDVTVIVTSYLNTDWYVRQLRNLTTPCPDGVDPGDDPTRIICQRPYDPSGDPAMYTADPAEAEALGKTPIPLDRPVRAPTRSILDLSDEVIVQTTRSFVPVRERITVPLGRAVATFEEGHLFYPWHQFALSAIGASLDERPVYFASTTAAQYELGISDHLVRQGLAFRLYDRDLDAEPERFVAMSASPYSQVIGDRVDFPRTRTLVWEVFQHRSGIPDEWDVWPDRPSIGIPNYYAWAYYALAQIAAQLGDSEALERNQERGDAWGALGS